MSCTRALIVDDNLVIRQQISLLIRETIDPSAMIVESPSLHDAKPLAPFLMLQGATTLATPRCTFVSASIARGGKPPKPLRDAFAQACGVILVHQLGESTVCPPDWQPWVVAELRHARLGPENRTLLAAAMQQIKARSQQCHLARSLAQQEMDPDSRAAAEGELGMWLHLQGETLAQNEPQFLDPQPSPASSPRPQELAKHHMAQIEAPSLAVNDEPLRHELLDKLTRRETQTLFYVAKGFTIREMSHLMNIKWFTVNDHLKSIYRKLNVSSRAEAAVIATKGGLV